MTLQGEEACGAADLCNQSLDSLMHQEHSFLSLGSCVSDVHIVTMRALAIVLFRAPLNRAPLKAFSLPPVSTVSTRHPDLLAFSLILCSLLKTPEVPNFYKEIEASPGDSTTSVSNL